MKTLTKQDKFISTIIDNLKTPTIAQIKALEMFLATSSEKIKPEEKDLIRLTLDSCNNMQKMIDNFSFVTKISNEKMDLSYVHFDLIELVSGIIKEVEILLKYSNLKINIKNNKQFDCYSDKLKIKKAIENLLSYAINSAYENSTIDIEINKNKEGIKFGIILNGYCENNKEILQIFKQSQNYSTKYIELFIAKEIIKAHYGKIIFKNMDDEIILIGFTLPSK